MAQQRTSGRAAHSSRKQHAAGEASGRRWRAEMRPAWLRGRPAEDGHDWRRREAGARQRGERRDRRQQTGRAQPARVWRAARVCVARGTVVRWLRRARRQRRARPTRCSTGVGMEREWPRGRGRRAAGSGMGVHRSGHVPRGQSKELGGYPCNGHGGRRFSATAKYLTRANERGNWGKARGDHGGVNGALGEDMGARGGADRTTMSRWPKVEEDGSDVDAGVLDLISLAQTK